MTDSTLAQSQPQTLIKIYFLIPNQSQHNKCNNPTKYHFIIANGVTKLQDVLLLIVFVLHVNLAFIKKIPGLIKMQNVFIVKSQLKENLSILR